MKIQKDIGHLGSHGSWARKWRMRIQPVKCNMMQQTKKRIHKIQASYILEGTVLETGISISSIFALRAIEPWDSLGEIYILVPRCERSSL